MNIEFNKTWCVSKFPQDCNEIIQVIHRPSGKAIRDNYYIFLHNLNEVVSKLKRELTDYQRTQNENR